MREHVDNLKKNLEHVISGKPEAVELMLIALCGGGNILMEDVPGVGKTTMAKALAKSIHGTFHRIQFTPDLLPSDIVGTSIFNPKEGTFTFRKGPVFSNVLLADEINRASPRTQSALLEAMNEGQVTAEGHTYSLPKPFLVIATENPVEYYGTYPLPEAQLDRFAIQIIIGYPDLESELQVLYSRKEGDPADEISSVVDSDTISAIQCDVRRVGIEKTVAGYMAEIVRATRTDDRIKLGASPRALITLSRSAQARAYIKNRDYVTPDDVKTLAVCVLAHRIVLDNKTKHSGIRKENVIEDILSKIEVPT